MTGPGNGIIGTDAQTVIDRFLTHLPARFTVADGEITTHGALFDVDEGTGRVRRVERIVY